MKTADINLVSLIERFHSEDASRAFLESLRWPDGIECPRCQGKTISRIVKRDQFDCDSCRYQFSVTAGTIFHDSKLPLWKWFLAAYIMSESKKGVSANQMKRMLSVSYKTAWYLCHRIRAAMTVVNPEPLTGVIEADETWIGGRKKGQGRGNWRDGKTMVLGAIERGGQVRLKVDKRAGKKIIHAFLEENTGEIDALYTDEHGAYQGFSDRHSSVVHRSEEWVRGDVHTNSVEGVWSLFKRSIVGSYHQLSEKHLDAYLDEFEWRFNNRENPYLFRDTLIKLVNANTLEYKELISSSKG
jgi:transposase-like protein